MAKNFGNLKNLHEDNRPWDYDHFLPQAKSTASTAKMCWSSGNNVPIALTTNRSKQDELPNVNYPDNNPDIRPDLTWRATSNCLYSNWLNYYVYQITPYIL